MIRTNEHRQVCSAESCFICMRMYIILKNDLVIQRKHLNMYTFSIFNVSSYLAQQREGPRVGRLFAGDGDREAGAGFYIHSF